MILKKISYKGDISLSPICYNNKSKLQKLPQRNLGVMDKWLNSNVIQGEPRGLQSLGGKLFVIPPIFLQKKIQFSWVTITSF